MDQVVTTHVHVYMDIVFHSSSKARTCTCTCTHTCIFTRLQRMLVNMHCEINILV